MKYITIILLSVVMLVSCEGRSNSFTSQTKSGQISKLIDAHIDTMGVKPWDKAVYQDILENQIQKFNGTSNAKTSLKHKLDYVYGTVLVRDGNKILDNCDKPLHKKLSALMAELKKFPDAENSAALRDRYSQHEKICSFVSSMYAKQEVKSYAAKYDSDFERRIQSQADEYLAMKLTCKYLKVNLSSTKTIFRNRRLDYASKIVDLYCQEAEYDSKKERMLKSSINEACGSIPDTLSAKIEDYRASHIQRTE